MICCAAHCACVVESNTHTINLQVLFDEDFVFTCDRMILLDTDACT